jgi:hypothetical protein
MQEITKREALFTMSTMGLHALASWFLQFFWFLARLFIAMAIGWGFIGSLEPFPHEVVRSWQEAMSSATLYFPGGQVFQWCAGEWFEIAVLVLLLNSVRARRVLNKVTPNTHHAAFAVSAIANYLSINPTTPRLLGMEKKAGIWESFWKPIFSDVFYGLFFRIFSRVPFLPDEAIPERDGQAANLKEDLERFVPLSSHNNSFE